ncbi:hypothetical protein [Endozoicomonas lisbonensis]|uniref:Uncharacterized protein n=1 Tax=Endozoicomonas lisbonensis TaxID=3120522 RepID=A0ABV2SI98_9GAMM
MAIGIEFQTNWQVYQEANTEHRAPPSLQEYPKTTPLFGSRTGIPGYSMETDSNEVEFVVEPPFDETDSGRARLIQVMDNLTAHIAMMDSYNCSMRKSSHPQVFSANAPPDVVIMPYGNRPTSAQPQVTIGLRLGRIREFVMEMGRLGLQPCSNSLFDSGAGQSPYYSHQYLRAAEKAAAGPLPTDSGQPPSNKLKGLLTMTTQYLLGGAKSGTRSYTKSLTWAMARTDFASMFAQLPYSERSYFNANPDRWVHYALVTAGLDNAGNTDQAAREFLVQARISDVHTLDHPVRIPITRGMWLRDMALGINAIDRFSERGTNTPAMHMADGIHRLSALGKLGNTFDQVGLPKKSDENRRHPGVILELRQMRRHIPYTEWKQVALDVFDFTRQINNRSDKAGDPPVYFTGISQ